MPSLALCTYALPGGRACRQPRLRNQSHCRFHVRNQAHAEHHARMIQLNDQLESLSTPQLLEALRDKLANIRCYLRCYPEAVLALTIAIDRLNGLGPIESPMESMTGPEVPQNQSGHPNSNNLLELLENLREAMNYSR